MSDINFNCPDCKQHLEAPPGMAGDSLECPACGQQITVPTPTADVTPESEVDPHAATTDPVPQPEQPEEDVPPKKSGFGKSLLAATKAAGAEAKRRGELGALVAQIEKTRRIDLAKAHRAVGERAYEQRVDTGQHQAAYDELAELDAKIAEKTAGVSADDDAGVAAKAKAKAVSAKMRAEAEAFKHKRSTKLEELGKLIAESGEAPAGLETESAAVAAAQDHIAELEAKRLALRADDSARKEFAESSREVGAQAASGVRTSAQRVTATPKAKKRAAWAGAVVVLLAVIGGVVFFGNRRDQPASGRDVPQQRHETPRGPASPSNADANSLKAKAGCAMTFEVVASLSFDGFPGLSNLGSRLYEIEVLKHSSSPCEASKKALAMNAVVVDGRRPKGRALLITRETEFGSKGRGSLPVIAITDVDVTDKSGFERTVGVFVEALSKDVAAYAASVHSGASSSSAPVDADAIKSAFEEDMNAAVRSAVSAYEKDAGGFQNVAQLEAETKRHWEEIETRIKTAHDEALGLLGDGMDSANNRERRERNDAIGACRRIREDALTRADEQCAELWRSALQALSTRKVKKSGRLPERMYPLSVDTDGDQLYVFLHSDDVERAARGTEGAVSILAADPHDLKEAWRSPMTPQVSGKIRSCQPSVVRAPKSTSQFMATSPNTYFATHCFEKKSGRLVAVIPGRRTDTAVTPESDCFEVGDCLLFVAPNSKRSTAYPKRGYQGLCIASGNQTRMVFFQPFFSSDTLIQSPEALRALPKILAELETAKSQVDENGVECVWAKDLVVGVWGDKWVVLHYPEGVASVGVGTEPWYVVTNGSGAKRLEIPGRQHRERALLI